MVEGLANDFRNTLAGFCREQRENRSTVREYSMNSAPAEDSLQFILLDEYEEAYEQIRGALSPEALPPFNNEQRVTNNLRFYAIPAQFENGDVLVGFRWITPAQKPDRGKWPVTAVRNRTHGRYERLVEDIVLFDEKLDCILYKDIVFIKNRGKFENIFNFDQVIRAAASAALLRLGQEVTIKNFEEFHAACMRSVDKQRKLDAISQKVDLSKLTVEGAQRVITENPQLDSILETDDNGYLVLTYDSSNPWHLLKYLSLSTGWSVATGDAFESHSHDLL